MNFQLFNFPELETSRLRLRKVTSHDAETILHIRSDASINQFIKRDAPKNIEDANTFIRKVNAGFVAGESIYWAICFKADQKMVGSICLWHFNTEFKKAELGYDLKSTYQQQGIMTEAMQRVLKFGYEKLNLIEMEAFTHFENERSISLLMKNNFRLVEGDSDPDNPNNVIYRISQSIESELD